MYLLAKKLPHTLVSGESEKFKEELKNTTADEIVRFAEAVKSADQTIDGKVCKAATGGSTRSKCKNDSHAGAGNAHQGLSGYAEAVLKGSGGAAKWPKNGPEEDAANLADDLSKSITRDERNKAAGLLSKTISGAEVVEIRAVSTSTTKTLMRTG